MDNSNQNTSEGRFEEMVGRIKEAAGVLFGHRDMKNEGRADQWTGQAKSTASEAIDEVRDSVESVVDKLDEKVGSDAERAPEAQRRKHDA